MAVTGPHPLSSALSALPHQDRVADKLEDAPASQGILAHHGTGTGKTFTAINAAKRLNLPILAITPASLRTNFKKEMTAAGNPVPHQIVSYQEALNRINNPEFRALAQRSLVVADEAQNFGQDGSERSSLMSRLPGRKLLLSATPIRNSPHEIAPLINAAAPGSLPEGQAAFDSKYVETKEVPVGFWGRLRGAKPGVIHVPTNLDDFAKAVKGKVDFHENIDRSNFPTYHESIIQVPMTPKQQATYDFVLGKYPAMAYKVRHGIPPSKTESKNMTAFFSGPRQISNHPGEFNASATDDDAPKFKAAADEIQKRMKVDKNFRGVAYSNFLEAGMDPMSRELDRRGISHVKFNGDMNDKEKAEAVKQYNTGQVPVLLISGAGAEGLDLKGTKLMQIMEPHWNEEKINQVRGRAIRYKSHSHLPEEERHVEVHRYHAVPVMSWLGNMMAKAPYGHGADEYIHHIAKEKQELNQPFLDVLKREGGEQNSKAAEVDSFLFVEFTKTAVAPFQAMANLPRMLAGNNSGTWHSAMHGLADKLEVPAQAVDRRITRTGKQVSGTFSDMMNPSGAYRSYRPGAGSVDAKQMKYDKHLTKSTGVPHVDGLPNFEHPEVKSVMDRVHAGELKTPEFPDHDEELHMYRWAKQQSSLPKTPAPVAPPVNQVARNLTLPTRPGYGLSPMVLPANHKLPFPSMKTGTIMSQLHPDDPTKRFDYSHEIGELQRRPQMMAAKAQEAAVKEQEAAAKAEESEQAKADAAVTKKQDLEFRSQERALKLQLHEAKLHDYALKLQGQKQKQEHEQLKRIHDQANMEVESASNGVAEAQQRLDAALASLSGETPVSAKAAEWTSPTNLAVHADKHGHEFGGADNYIAAEAALSENPPEDLQPVNSRCQLPSADPAHVPRCSTAYFSPSLQVMHVKDNASQKTVTLYRRTKAPLPSLNTSSAGSPPPTP
jgi:superfamily II DNA or RNA helicase